MDNNSGFYHVIFICNKTFSIVFEITFTLFKCTFEYSVYVPSVPRYTTISKGTMA